MELWFIFADDHILMQKEVLSGVPQKFGGGAKSVSADRPDAPTVTPPVRQ